MNKERDLVSKAKAHGSVLTVAHMNHIGMRKLTARWVPNLLALSKLQLAHEEVAGC